MNKKYKLIVCHSIFNFDSFICDMTYTVGTVSFRFEMVSSDICPIRFLKVLISLRSLSIFFFCNSRRRLFVAFCLSVATLFNFSLAIFDLSSLIRHKEHFPFSSRLHSMQFVLSSATVGELVTVRLSSTTYDECELAFLTVCSKNQQFNS